MSRTIYDATPECDRPFTLEEIFAEMDRFEERVALDLALYKTGGYAPTEERKTACEEELETSGSCRAAHYPLLGGSPQKRQCEVLSRSDQLRWSPFGLRLRPSACAQDDTIECACGAK